MIHKSGSSGSRVVLAVQRGGLLASSPSATAGISCPSGLLFWRGQNGGGYVASGVPGRSRSYCSSSSSNRSSSAAESTHNKPSTSKADIVVCGGGVLGLSTALHLAQMGTSQKILLLEQNNAKGVPTTLFSFDEVAGLSGSLFNHQDVQGCLMIEDDRMIDMDQLCEALAEEVRSLGVEIVECNPVNEVLVEESGESHFTEHHHHGPSTSFSPPKTTTAAQQHQNKQQCHHRLRVVGVSTPAGDIETDRFIDVSGLNVGQIPIGQEDDHHGFPVTPVTYSYLLADIQSESAADGSSIPFAVNVNGQQLSPWIFDVDKKVYVAGNMDGGQGKSVVCGGYLEDSIRPYLAAHHKNSSSVKHADAQSKQLADWDLFYPVLNRVRERFPMLGDAKVNRLYTSLESYSPDGYPIVGSHPRIDGYFLAGGMNGYGSGLGVGLGELLARWVHQDGVDIQQDVSRLEVSRFLDVHANPTYMLKRAPEVASTSYRPLPLSHRWHTARDVRKSPIYPHLKAAGAVFSEVMGYERPLYFRRDEPSEDLASKEVAAAANCETHIGKPPWFDYVRKEYEACRERVALIDMSHFSKFEIISESTESVVNMLQRVCSADVDKPVGTTIYTGLQNNLGGYITDCTMSRLAPNHYFMVAPTVQQERCRLWLEKMGNTKGVVQISDVTSMYTAINVLGPLSRHLLQELTPCPMTPDVFPAFHCKEISLGVATGIRAISVTHCGELGWVLYTPNEFVQGVYEEVVRAGEEYGLAHAGYLTLRHLRIEKFYVYWGMDIDSTTTPSQCGRLFRVNLDKKEEFIGREAIVKEAAQAAGGVSRKYVQFLLEGHDINVDPWPFGDEPIYRNGKHVGWTTTAAYGFTIGSQVCIGFVEGKAEGLDLIEEKWLTEAGAVYEVEVGGRRFKARLNLHSPKLPMVSSEHPHHFRPTRI